MLLLDLFKFCEGYDKYTRQHIARMIYKHKDSERMAKNAGLPHREFVSLMSKEFVSRCMTEGYLDCRDGLLSCRGRLKRPLMMKLSCVDGYRMRYCYEMMNLEGMSDRELFGKGRNVDRSERRILLNTPVNGVRI